MLLPSYDEIKALHEKYAPEAEALMSVWGHCQIVRDISLQLVDRYPSMDRELVAVGALLHDIGVYKLYENGVLNKSLYVTHGLLGYELLKAEGYDEVLCRFALLHTGVGLSKQDVLAQRLPLPVNDYMPETDEEIMVMYADKFHSKKTPPTFNSAHKYSEYLSIHFGDNKARQFDALVKKFGEPDLMPLIRRHGHQLDGETVAG